MRLSMAGASGLEPRSVRPLGVCCTRYTPAGRGVSLYCRTISFRSTPTSERRGQVLARGYPGNRPCTIAGNDASKKRSLTPTGSDPTIVTL